MARRADRRERALQALRAARDGATDGDDPALSAQLDEALASDHGRLLALAAGTCAERLLHDREPELIAAFDRLCALPHDRDPGCPGKRGLLRALADLDCLDAAVFRRGLAVVQAEPVWGGTQDTAGEVRATAALGLAATGHPRALIDLVGVLWDPEASARVGAARAATLLEPVGAQALLRARALAGDQEPAVVDECLRGLLELDVAGNGAFVASFLDGDDAEVAELAALALGGSRDDDAVALLRERWDEAPFKGDRELALLRAAALHRGEAHRAWLLDVLASGNARAATALVEALAVFRHDEVLAEALRSAVATYEEPGPAEAFRMHWEEEADG